MSFKLPYAKHLLNDEVDYELRVRSCHDDTNLDLNAKYELLQKLYHEDSQEKREYLSIYTIEQDFDFILSRVTSIELALREKKDPKLISRLKYYYVRAKNSRVNSPRSKEMREALVKRVVGDHCYELEDEKGKRLGIFNCKYLKKLHEPPSTQVD